MIRNVVQFMRMSFKLWITIINLGNFGKEGETNILYQFGTYHTTERIITHFSCNSRDFERHVLSIRLVSSPCFAPSHVALLRPRRSAFQSTHTATRRGSKFLVSNDSSEAIAPYYICWERTSIPHSATLLPQKSALITQFQQTKRFFFFAVVTSTKFQVIATHGRCSAQAIFLFLHLNHIFFMPVSVCKHLLALIDARLYYLYYNQEP